MRSLRCARALTGALVVVLAAPALPAMAQQLPAPIAADAGAAPVVAHRGAPAPADEYFGRLKMSILGVRNVVNDVDRRIDAAADTTVADLCHKLVVAEDALRDWQRKYPDDAWIPRLGYAMVDEYERLDAAALSEEFHLAGTHAVDLASFLETRYPGSPFAPK